MWTLVKVGVRSVGVRVLRGDENVRLCSVDVRYSDST